MKNKQNEQLRYTKTSAGEMDIGDRMIEKDQCRTLESEVYADCDGQEATKYAKRAFV